MPKGIYPRTREHLRLLDYARSQNKYIGYSERMKLNNPMNNIDIIKKHKESMNNLVLKENYRKNNPMKRKEVAEKSGNTRKKCYKDGTLKHNRIGTYLSDITKEKIRVARRKQILPLKDTSIEIKIQKFLKELGIKFYTHQHINIEHYYQCDIFIPIQERINQPTIIECDGDYWHGNQKVYPNLNEWQLKQMKKDKIRTKELYAKGYRIIRLWENEIKIMCINKFKELAYVENNSSTQIEQELSMKQEAITSTGVRL